jgi:hypothetical protein
MRPFPRSAYALSTSLMKRRDACGVVTVAPPQKRTRAVLACGHAVTHGGAAESWYGVAAPCPTCRCDVNVASTKLGPVPRSRFPDGA